MHCSLAPIIQVFDIEHIVMYVLLKFSNDIIEKESIYCLAK